jgi:hypothetical protein
MPALHRDRGGALPVFKNAFSTHCLEFSHRRKSRGGIFRPDFAIDLTIPKLLAALVPADS